MTIDAVVIGSGPNGLAAAITLARQGYSVVVFEAAETIGGGMRSAELTLPGYVHDVCSAIHPMAVASPLFRTLPLDHYGLEWIHPDIPVAHPFPDGRAAMMYQSLEETADGFGVDANSYRRLIRPFVDSADELVRQVLGPLRWPRHPFLMTRFARHALTSAERLAKRRFRDDRVQGMFAGMAAHSVLPLDRSLTAAVGLLFCVTAHSRGWPFPRGGSQSLANALADHLRFLGGQIQTGRSIEKLSDLPPSRAILFDASPAAMCRIAGTALPASYRRSIRRFRHGPGVFKIDWALNEPIPWKAEQCRKAGTVHVGGSFDEVAAAERTVWSGVPAERPFVLVAQQSLFDPTRAVAGKHTGWAYCHVPHGSNFDMTQRIESQIERFAPGFRDIVLHRNVTTPSRFESHNANYVGGDITGGVMDIRQLFTRPVARFNPYTTPAKNIFICSASSPPGAGVHGMCGYYAAKAAISRVLK